jgi:hypothetical protein
MGKPNQLQPKQPKLPGTLSPDDVPITNPRDVSAIYSNHFGISATASDFTIYFLEIGQTPGPKGPIHKQEIKAIVTIPLIMAAGMVQVLQQVLQNHTNQLEELRKQMVSGE